MSLASEIVFLDSVNHENAKLTHEHEGGLHVRVGEKVTGRLSLVLRVLDQGVGSAEDEHTNHDRVSHAEVFFRRLFHTIPYLFIIMITKHRR
jgi:hypothetical protein